MRPELDRIKKDLETMAKSSRVSNSMGSDWLLWMKRDRWIGLWWCLPGLILIATALVPHDRAQRYFGLVIDQWAGLLVGAVLLGLMHILTRKVVANDGRPPALIREAKLLNGFSIQGFWFMLAIALQLSVYFVWGMQYGIPFKPFWSGLFILMGSSCPGRGHCRKGLAAAGMGDSLFWRTRCACQSQTGTLNSVAFCLGLMFIAVALSLLRNRCAANPDGRASK
jgi:hypothetical protein